MLLVKLIEPPCTERYARWCERTEISQLEKFPPTRLFEERLRLCSDYEANSEKIAFIDAKLEELGVKELTEEEGFEPLEVQIPF